MKMKLQKLIKYGFLATSLLGNAMAGDFIIQQLDTSKTKDLSRFAQSRFEKQCLKRSLSFIFIEELEKHSVEFRGANNLDQQIVAAYQVSYTQFDGKVTDAFYAFNNPAMYPIAQKLSDYLTDYALKFPHHQPTKRFLWELDFHIEGQDISPLWLLGMHLRFAASVSTITEDEKDLLSHVPFPNLYFGLIEKDAWRNSHSSYVSISEYNNEGLELSDEHVRTNIQTAVLTYIEDTIERLLPPQILYPMLGQNKLGISFMVKCYLDDNFPVVFPNQPVNGHGIKFSQFGFPIHDMLHQKVDRRHYELISHVVSRADAFVGLDGDAWQFAKIYSPVAVERYHALMGGLRDVYGNMVTKLLPYHGLREYRKAMLGFFWILHEAPNFAAQIYNMNDFDKVLETITKPSSLSAVNAALNEIDSWESSFDPFSTSPIDGSTNLTDDDIYNHPIFESLLLEDAQGYKYSSRTDKGRSIGDSYCDDCIVDQQVIRTNRFIDVIFKMFDGEELKYSFPTLFQKWTNLDDNIGLLKYAGTIITKSDLTTAEDPRQVALETLDNVRKALDSHVERFHKVAFFFSNYDPHGNEKSLAKRYFRKHFAQEKWVTKELDAAAYYSDDD
jgi:hypothetical protein